MRAVRWVLLFIVLVAFSQWSVRKKELQVVFISGCNEYFSHISLQEYRDRLQKTYGNVRVTLLQADGPLNKKNEYSRLNGTEALKHCDVLLIYARRTTISGPAMDNIKEYVNAGKAVVALRTSSHGFESWPEFDKQVLGGNYHNHFQGHPEKAVMGEDGMYHPGGEPGGPEQSVTVNSLEKNHPVLAGVKNFRSKYSLYQTAPLAEDARLLLTGKTPEGEQPVAWTRNHHGGRIVYIGLGGLQDWQNEDFEKLVTNALFWTAGVKGKQSN